jgi:hypothetical protein
MLTVIVGFGVLMGWAHARLLLFSSRSSLRIGMLPIIIKKDASRTFLDNLGLGDIVVMWFVIL